MTKVNCADLRRKTPLHHCAEGFRLQREAGVHKAMWVWRKIQAAGANRRFWSWFQVTRVPHFLGTAMWIIVSSQEGAGPTLHNKHARLAADLAGSLIRLTGCALLRCSEVSRKGNDQMWLHLAFNTPLIGAIACPREQPKHK